LNVSFFHSGILIIYYYPNPFKDYANVLVPNSAFGSSQYLLHSFGIESIIDLHYYSLISLLSIAYYLAFNASLFNVPSGFFTIFGGLKFIPHFVVYPFKNGASSSLSSISNTSSSEISDS